VVDGVSCPTICLYKALSLLKSLHSQATFCSLSTKLQLNDKQHGSRVEEA
jgi:hypothetical protein